MTSYLEYRLNNGYIHNWLVAGPQVFPIQDLESYIGGEESKRDLIYQHLPEMVRQQLQLDNLPSERGEFEVWGKQLAWRYLRCMDDHLVDLSTTVPLWNHLNAWAFTMLKLPSQQAASFELTTSGPAEVWLNGLLVHRQVEFHIHDWVSCSFPVDLKEGENQLLVRFEMVGVHACPLTLALKVAGLPAEVENKAVVRIATSARYPRRHEIIEEAFERAYLEEAVNHRGAHVNLRWSDEKGPKLRYAYQVQDREGWVYVEGAWETDPEKPYDVGHGFRLNERPYFVTLRPIILEYFEHNLRYEKKYPIYVIDNAFASVPTGEFAQRNREALEDAAKYNDNLFAEIARMGLGRWAQVNPELVLDHIQKVNRREAGSSVTLMGLLGIMHRFQNEPKFPSELKQPLEECILNFRYWADEDPGASHDNDGLVFNSESDSLLFHTCQALAGQLYPEKIFARSGESGQQQRMKGESLALDWLRLRGAWGFQDWDSNDTFEKHILALSHLVSFAEDTRLREMAAVMMDKLFFSLAVNSYKGSFGSTHGCTSASMLKSSQLEATSGISRMLWGTGVFNDHILGTVSLATSSYEFPLLIGEVANDQASTIWSRERHKIDPELGLEVNKVTYRTPDYMLCSAQDYRPGERGKDEHIWQATLGSDALVFVNHPASFSNAEEQRPGFWLGNRSLPRVAQWKDTLLAIFHLPEDDWMGFTHAFFPVYQFSEYEIKTENGQTWAFARKENGYLALAASEGFELIKRAPDGYRELRSYAKNNIWLCQMGRAEMDGNFEWFKSRVLASKFDRQGLNARYKTPRGDYMSFGWEGPFVVNGKEKPLSGYKHYDNPYCVVDLPATQMEIQANGTIMRLDFS